MSAERLRELTVIENDDGIRPAGAPDRCFYCNQQIGELHLVDCAVVVKEIELVATFKTSKGEEMDDSLHFRVEVPHFWDDAAILFHFNDATWCMDNIGGYVEDDDEERANAIWKRVGVKKGQCMCGYAKVHLGRVIDAGPYILKREPGDEDKEETP